MEASTTQRQRNKCHIVVLYIAMHAVIGVCLTSLP